MRPHQPRKRFGQHFLSDPHYVNKIIEAIDPQPDDNMVEIGPGLGALTRPLVERVSRLSVIEIDRDLAPQLEAELADSGLQMNVADALEFDYASLGPCLRVVGNLPYNISSPLLFTLANYVDSIRDITVMLQREVVERMTALPNTTEYGRLSVMLQIDFAIRRLFYVPAGAFKPPPKVESAVARLTPVTAKPTIVDRRLFSQLVMASFGQRRKTLRNALKRFCSESQIEDAGVDACLRGEALTVSDFVRLSNALSSNLARKQA